MNKIKIKLLPSLREKKRYLVFEVVSNEAIDNFSKISNNLLQSTQKLIGEIGMSKGNISILNDCWNKKMQRGVIKLNTKYLNDVKTGLALVKEINNEDVIIRTVGVSGILKKAKQKYLSS